TPGGLATQFSSAGHFGLAEDQAMIVTVPAADRATAPYQGIQLGSMWYVSLDYINHQTSLTADQARIDPDGQMRFVISEPDPGLGRSIALTSAREGADVVLAARTAPRLDDVAKEVTALGRRGLAVPTDLADATAASRLAEAAIGAFGRVDALVYNALAMPPIK